MEAEAEKEMDQTVSTAANTAGRTSADSDWLLCFGPEVPMSSE